MAIELNLKISIEDILDLPSVDFCHLERLPEKSYGLYFVLAIIDGQYKLIYVGKTDTSFNERWKKHHRIPEISVLARLGISVFVAWYEMQIDGRALRAWEELIIQKFQPLLNTSDVLVKSSIKHAVKRTVVRAEMPRIPKHVVSTSHPELSDEVQLAQILDGYKNGLPPSEIVKKSLGMGKDRYQEGKARCIELVRRYADDSVLTYFRKWLDE